MANVRRAGTAAVAALVLSCCPALAATSFPNDYFFHAQWYLTGATSAINAPSFDQFIRNGTKSILPHPEDAKGGHHARH